MYFLTLGEVVFDEILIDQVFKLSKSDVLTKDNSRTLETESFVPFSNLILAAPKFSLVCNNTSEKFASVETILEKDLPTVEDDNLVEIPFNSKTIKLDFSNIQCLISNYQYQLNKYMTVHIIPTEDELHTIHFYIKDNTASTYKTLYQEMNLTSLEDAHNRISEILDGINLRESSLRKRR
jgi:hypothetical protein